MPMTPIPAPPGKKLDWIINNWSRRRTVEQIECEDGYKLSVQASGIHYCTDAEGERKHYWNAERVAPVLPFSSVEVMATDAPDSWEEYDSAGVYAHVPVRLVRAFIASHGGEKGASGRTQLDRIEALLEQVVANTTKPGHSLTLHSTTTDLDEIAENIRRVVAAN